MQASYKINYDKQLARQPKIPLYTTKKESERRWVQSQWDNNEIDTGSKISV